MAHTLSLGIVLTGLATSVLGASYTPLTDRRYTYPDQIPYKVDTERDPNDPTDRGPQFGYTLCNSTTEGQSSDCQLAMLNNLADFCLWGPPDMAAIGDAEAFTVAWCTQPGHGARTMPAGTLTGVQVLKAPAYVLFSGTLKQENINIPADDGGGELDPHGADQRGNPLGALVYTNAFPSNNGNNGTYQQVIEWHNFMGSETFCFKICDPTIAGSETYCNNIFDRTGCSFVAPASYQEGVFEVCESENQDPVGVYTGSDGKTSTYKQPAEGVDITSLPSIKTPSSSQCSTFSSADLYAAAGSVTISGASTTATGSTTPSGTGSTTAATGKTTVTSKPASGTSSPTTSPATSSGAASLGAKPFGFDLGPLAAVLGAAVMGAFVAY